MWGGQDTPLYTERETLRLAALQHSSTRLALLISFPCHEEDKPQPWKGYMMWGSLKPKLHQCNGKSTSGFRCWREKEMESKMRMYKAMWGGGDDPRVLGFWQRQIQMGWRAGRSVTDTERFWLRGMGVNGESGKDPESLPPLHPTAVI